MTHTTEQLNGYCLQEQQRVVLDKQVQEKQKAKLQQQQDKVQDAQDLAAALRQYKLDEAKTITARKAAAVKSKALMANQVRFIFSKCYGFEGGLAQVHIWVA